MDQLLLDQTRPIPHAILQPRRFEEEREEEGDPAVVLVLLLDIVVAAAAVAIGITEAAPKATLQMTEILSGLAAIREDPLEGIGSARRSLETSIAVMNSATAATMSGASIAIGTIGENMHDAILALKQTLASPLIRGRAIPFHRPSRPLSGLPALKARKDDLLRMQRKITTLPEDRQQFQITEISEICGEIPKDPTKDPI
jgi:hypothetical protein